MSDNLSKNTGRGLIKPYIFPAPEDLESKQKEAVVAELNASNTQEESLDFSENLNRMIQLMKDRIKTSTYIELKGFINELDGSEKSLENIKFLWNAANAMDSIANKVTSASLIKNNNSGYMDHMDKFYAESDLIKKEFEKLREEIQKELDVRYGDKEPTTKFLTQETITGLLHSIVDIAKKESPDIKLNTPEEIVKFAKNSGNIKIRLLLSKMILFERREFIVAELIDKILFARIGHSHLRDLRKVKQFLRGNYNETFRKTQNGLVLESGYSVKQLSIFEKGVLEYTKYTETETITFFTWLKRSIFDRDYKTEFINLDREVINILIMNVIDIKAGIWKDEEMKLTGEQFMKSVEVLFQVFEKDSNMSNYELSNQLKSVYRAPK